MQIDTGTAILAIAILVIAFLIGSVTDLHMGIMAITATAIVGPLVFNDSIKVLREGFPINLFFTLMGVTYMFAIANNNGTVNWIVAMGLKLVAGKAMLFPFVMFFITAILTAIGCATPAAAAILMPIAMGFNRQNDINPLPMAMAVIQGGSAGSFSPMGVYGAIINSVVTKAKIPPELYNPMITFGVGILMFFAILVVTWILYPGAGPTEEEAAAYADDSIDREASEAALVDEEFGDQSGKKNVDFSKITLNAERATTLAGIGVLTLLVVISSVWKKQLHEMNPAFGVFDVGLTALAIGAVLTLMFPEGAKGAVMQIAWPTILLVGGIVTYISMLENHGIIQWLGDMAAGLGNPKFSSILILFLGALVSAFASTTGILGALIPLSVPFLVGDNAALSATMLIGALGISSATVDCSPFSTNGALAVANGAHQGDYIYKAIFKWAWILIVGTPIVTWALMILPPWGSA